MSRIPAVLALLVLLGAGAVVLVTRPGTAPRLVLTRVTVVDVAAGRLLPDQAVVVVGSRIRSVGPAGTVRTPRGARVVDAAGGYLVPGLWDMHVHTVGRGAPDAYFPLLVANGITGVRDMGDDLSALRRLRDSAARGRVVSPRLRFGGRIDGPGPRPPFALGAETPDRGRAAVDSLHRLGVDFIKIPASLPRDTYFAIVAAARARRLPFAGHVPYPVTAREASDAGQASLEHEDDLMLACTSRERELRARIAAAARSDDRRTLAPVVREVAAAVREHPDERACAELIAALAGNRTWVTPTLVVYQPYARGFDSAVTRSPRLRYVPRGVRASWERRAAERSPGDDRAVGSYFSPELTGRMHRAGVGLLAGTDTPLPYVVPGFSLHDELRLLVEAGLSPAEALRTATLNPARYWGATDSLGTVAPGKLADLVLLDADPLKDVRATQRIRAVVLDGRYLDRPALDRLLARAAAGAAGAR